MKKTLFTLFALTLVFTLALGSINVYADFKLEAEEYDEATEDDNPVKPGDMIKTEETKNTNVGDISNVGATFDGAWIAFSQVPFSGETKVTVQYCNNSARCAADAKLEFRLGSEDGELIATVELPATGDNWGAYGTASADLTKAVEGKHDLYVVMSGTTAENQPYISNLDYFEFTGAKSSNNGDDNNGGDNGGNDNKGGDDNGDDNQKTADPSMAYAVIVAAVAAYGGLRLRRK